jgi:cold shock CspA family protein
MPPGNGSVKDRTKGGAFFAPQKTGRVQFHYKKIKKTSREKEVRKPGRYSDN